MKTFLNLLFCSALILLAGNYASAQEKRQTVYEPKVRKLITTKTPEKIKEAKDFGSTSEDEASYYAPIRYVIVYNQIFPTLNERRIEILIDEKSYTEEILATVFQHIARKYPSPQRLSINAHTNLATIETPEERQMLRDGSDSRFEKVRDRYKESGYNRFENGREAFILMTPTKPVPFEVIVLEEGTEK
jgi:hypothetical protein